MKISYRTPMTTSLIAFAIIFGVGWMAKLPTLSDADRERLASSFEFDVLAIPESATEPKASVVDTHPALDHIAAWVSAIGASVAFGDFDEDGLENDLCLTEPRTKEALIVPAPDTGPRYDMFALDIAPHFDRAMSFPTGCLVGDYNSDGLDDMLIYFFGRAPLVAMRRATDDAPARLGPQAYVVSELIPGDDTLWYTAAATQADIDGDGHVDLVFGNYFVDDSRMYDPQASGPVEMQDSFSSAFNAGRNRILLWASATTGDAPRVRFSEATGVFSEEEMRAWTLAIGAADLDGDALPELYFANDYGPDRLFWNSSKPGAVRLSAVEGEGGPTIPKSKVLGRDSFKGMGVDFADVNGDGFFDMFVSNIAEEWALQESHYLWLSTGDMSAMKRGVAPYVDSGEELGVSRSYWGWDTRFGDFDNDGVVEMVQATGFLKGQVNRWPELAEFAIGNDSMVHRPQSWPHIVPGDDVSGNASNPFYARHEDGRYWDISPELGIDAPYMTRGIATSDIDGDGDLDIAFANQWEPSVLLLNKADRKSSFLALHVLAPSPRARFRATRLVAGHPSGPEDGSPAIGATVRVILPDDTVRIGLVDGGNGHAGASSKVVHMGLGDLSPYARLSVELRWRSAAGRFA